MQSTKLLFVANTSYYLYNFRRGLLTALRELGYTIVLAAPVDKYTPRLIDLGFQFEPIRNLDRKGVNPAKDVKLTVELFSLYRQVKPEIVFNFTIKPNIYGAFAAALCGIKSVSTATGLGYTFNKKGILNSIVKGLYRASMACNSKVVFQNHDDMRLFVEEGLVAPGKATTSPGSGVDLKHFCYSGEPATRQRFILISRMLRDKGVLEYAEAAPLVRKFYPDAELCLLGPIDMDSPAAVSLKEIKWLEKEGKIVYLGETYDVRPFIESACAVVLPSVYREGIPKVLLESLAMGKPIITTNSVGCKETVTNGYNGFLLANNSPEDIADAMIKLLALSPAERERMGHNSLEKACHEFDESIVIDIYNRIIHQVVVKERVFCHRTVEDC